MLQTEFPHKGSKKWQSKGFFPLNQENLLALFKNEIPAIKIDNFATLDECNMFTSILREHSFQSVTESVKRGEVSVITNLHEKPFPFTYSGHVKRVGISQSEYTSEERDRYFDASQNATIILNELKLRYSFDPLTRLLLQMKANYSKGSVSVETDSLSGRPYFAGLVRCVNSGTYPHFDYAPFHAGQEWEIGHVDYQLSWNLFLTQPNAGGETVIYDQLWTLDIEKTRNFERKKAYDRAIVQNVDSFTSVPTQGDLVLFNSRNFHEVLPTDCKVDRITFSSFVGMKGSGDIVLWS